MDPAIVTWVALAAVTVKVDEPPEEIEVGLAVMLTVGAAEAATVRFTVSSGGSAAMVPLFDDRMLCAGRQTQRLFSVGRVHNVDELVVRRRSPSKLRPWRKFVLAVAT